MTTAQLALAGPLCLVLVPLSVAKIAAVPFMRRAAAHLGMSPGHYRVIGLLEAAGIAGLLLGPASAPLGVAAVIGLALLSSDGPSPDPTGTAWPRPPRSTCATATLPPGPYPPPSSP
ncbi:DoxX family protein [Streptomyces sp. NPDC093568]|uniref:DoxX family protein n=1 Tax=Streptomyces sp. NPDC093568 TaxID=3366041 RepID=UPI00382AC1E8